MGGHRNAGAIILRSPEGRVCGIIFCPLPRGGGPDKIEHNGGEQIQSTR